MGALVNVIATFLLVKCVFGANILFIAPVASPSHHFWNRALAFALVEKGYNITMLSHNDEKKPPKNYHTILLEGLYEEEYEDFSLNSLIKDSAFTCVQKLYDWSRFCCKHDFKTKGLQQILDYPKTFKFDLIIYDITAELCLYPLIGKFNNPPSIAVTPFLLPSALSNLFGNPLQTSYFPFYSETYSNRMSLTEKFWNTIYLYYDAFYRKYIGLPAEMQLAKERFGANIQSFEEVERRFSLLLANFDPILTYPLDIPPNIIPVGGLQIKPPKPLPADLQKVVDEAKDGIILFTLGSNLRSDQLSDEMRNIILKSFEKLPQTILWKFESELEGLPKNVIIRKWLPQSDILGHPKTKLFITHGGGLGTQETMYHGVPVVSIPFSFDHRANSARLVHKNMARVVDFRNFTFENFYGALKEVLKNPMYTKNIKELSQRHRDQPQTPLERAVFWTEYIIRHGDAEDLSLPSRDMSEWQAINLDILAVLVFGVVLLYSLVLLLITIVKSIFTLFK